MLGDICSFIEQGIQPRPASTLALRQTGYRPCKARRRGQRARQPLFVSKSWRFDQHSGIGQLARACNSGDGAAVEAVWGAGFGDIRLPLGGEAYNALIAQGVAGYGSYPRRPGPGEDPGGGCSRRSTASRSCALWDGPFGVTGLNGASNWPPRQAGADARDGDRYAGRPVMVVRNDHGVGLYNGDMGLCLPDDTGRPRYGSSSRTAPCGPCCPAGCSPHETVCTP